MQWTVSGLHPSGGEIFHNHADQTWDPPSLLYKWYQACPSGKVAWVWSWPPTPPSAEVKEKVELYIYPASGPLWTV